ncbi:hypothetical protein M2133_000103 [Parabacteroides sp. PF5-6]|nr:hypothetical protein [Parabacteroides sp. PF5-6]
MLYNRKTRPPKAKKRELSSTGWMNWWMKKHLHQVDEKFIHPVHEKGRQLFEKGRRPFGKGRQPFGKLRQPFWKGRQPFGKLRQPFWKGRQLYSQITNANECRRQKSSSDRGRSSYIWRKISPGKHSGFESQSEEDLPPLEEDSGENSPGR